MRKNTELSDVYSNAVKWLLFKLEGKGGHPGFLGLKSGLSWSQKCPLSSLSVPDGLVIPVFVCDIKQFLDKLCNFGAKTQI